MRALPVERRKIGVRAVHVGPYKLSLLTFSEEVLAFLLVVHLFTFVLICEKDVLIDSLYELVSLIGTIDRTRWTVHSLQE